MLAQGVSILEDVRPALGVDDARPTPGVDDVRPDPGVDGVRPAADVDDVRPAPCVDERGDRHQNFSNPYYGNYLLRGLISYPYPVHLHRWTTLVDTIHDQCNWIQNPLFCGDILKK